MPLPDEAAAAEPQRVPLHTLTHEHVGAVITLNGVTGTLDAEPVPAGQHHAEGQLGVPLQEDGKSFLTAINADADTPVEILFPAPPSPYDEEANVAAGIPEHLIWARELAEITDTITVHTGEIAGLKQRAEELGRKLMGYFELAGDKSLSFDGRKAHLQGRTFAEYNDRPASEGGGKYNNADVVEALRAVGRAGDIKPESVLPQTMGKILREYRDLNKPVPPELAKIIKLGEEIKVAVGPPPSRRL